MHSVFYRNQAWFVVVAGGEEGIMLYIEIYSLLRAALPAHISAV